MKAVQRSWNAVRGDMDAIGQEFFSRMFELQPPLLKLFSFAEDPQWRTSQGLRVHAAAVMRTVRLFWPCHVPRAPSWGGRPAPSADPVF